VIIAGEQYKVVSIREDENGNQVVEYAPVV
jgi:hypothetical protein